MLFVPVRSCVWLVLYNPFYSPFKLSLFFARPHFLCWEQYCILVVQSHHRSFNTLLSKRGLIFFERRLRLKIYWWCRRGLATIDTFLAWIGEKKSTRISVIRVAHYGSRNGPMPTMLDPHHVVAWHDVDGSYHHIRSTGSKREGQSKDRNYWIV